jgi:hypothetical protein
LASLTGWTRKGGTSGPLVQKVSGGHFLARGRVLQLSVASGTDVNGS